MSNYRPGSPESPHTPSKHHQAFHHDDHRRGMPPLPDLSFERTYIKSIRRHIHTDVSGAHQVGFSTIQHIEAEDVHLDWGKVALVTVKDQMLMPFIQGAVW